MFDRFFRRSAKPAGKGHSLATAAGLSKLVRDLAHDNDRDLLDRVDELLEEVGEQAEAIGLRQAFEAARTLDEASREARERVLASYFRVHDPDRGSLALLERLSGHQERLGAVYSDLLGLVATPVPDELRRPVLDAADHYLKAWGLHRRLARFRQRPAGKISWEQAHFLVKQLLIWRLFSSSSPTPAPVLRQYLQVVYEETLPWGNLTAQQLEFAARLIANHEGLAWQSAMSPTTTHQIDLTLTDGPRRCVAGGSAEVRRSVRFLATGSLRQSVELLLAAVRAGEALPQWLTELAMEPMAITGALQTLACTWSSEPPRRESAREDRSRPLLGAFGFEAVRELLGICEKLKKEGVPVEKPAPGATPVYVSESNRTHSAYRFGGYLDHGLALPPSEEDARRAAAVQAGSALPEIVQPTEPDPDPELAAAAAKEALLAALRRLELAVPNLALEHWTEIDSSGTGVGVLLPALLPRHAAGVLIAWRYDDLPEWRIGFVRRVGRDAKARPTMGIELVPPGFTCVVHMLQAGSRAKTAWKDSAEWLLGVIPGEKSEDVLLPVGSFVPEMPVSVLSALGERRARLRTVRDRGSDWERVALDYRN